MGASVKPGRGICDVAGLIRQGSQCLFEVLLLPDFEVDSD